MRQVDENVLYLTAVIQGLEKLKYNCNVTIFTNNPQAINNAMKEHDKPRFYPYGNDDKVTHDIVDNLKNELLDLQKINGIKFASSNEGVADPLLKKMSADLAEKAIPSLHDPRTYKPEDNNYDDGSAYDYDEYQQELMEERTASWDNQVRSEQSGWADW